jgi:hypothetical protein
VAQARESPGIEVKAGALDGRPRTGQSMQPAFGSRFARMHNSLIG